MYPLLIVLDPNNVMAQLFAVNPVDTANPILE